MEQLAEIIAEDCIRIERTFDAPIDAVWPYISQSEFRAKWFAGGTIDLRIGGTIEFIFDHNSLSPKPGPVPDAYKDAIGYRFEDKITALEAPRLLGHGWGENGSHVAFTLDANGGRTRLTLIHSQLPDLAAMVDVAGGWHSHITVLSDVVEGRIPPNFWKIHDGVKAFYANAFGLNTP